MRFFYQNSPQKMEAALSDLVSGELEVGLVFEQQVKSSASVPDALISQRPLEIFFETKRGGKLDKAQIKRHITSIESTGRSSSRKILFGLTRTPISETDSRELLDQASRASITFVTATFADIVHALRQQCSAPHETDLQDILNDYEDYLISENLLLTGEMMIVVPCGTSMAENVKYSLYFEPSSRPSKASYKFIGLYSDKHVRQIGHISTVIIGRPEDNGFDVQLIERGNLSDEDIDRINGAIVACSYFPNFKEELRRYYLFDELEETSIQKKTKGGIWGPKALNVSEWLDYSKPGTEYSAAEVAQRAHGKHFE